MRAAVKAHAYASASALIGVACLALLGTPAWMPVQAQSGTLGSAPGDWPRHNRDLNNSRYSDLDGIDRGNVNSVGVRWTFTLPRGATVGSATPLVVDGVMYVNAGSTLFAIAAGTGELRWKTALTPEFKGGGRGPVYADGKVYAMGTSQVFSVDARTGEIVETFGTRGVLPVIRKAFDFKDPGLHPANFDPEAAGYLLQAPPTYHNGTLYFGTAVADSLITGGLVIAVNATTGTVKWVFRTIPQRPGDDGWDLAKDTWSGAARQGGGVWTQPAIDPALGLLYVNVSNPSPNYDGSSRKGANLFTNSIVALDLETGKLRWHQQVIHHDVWDWDLMTGPTLFETEIAGRKVRALASLAKTCYVYALDRETGQPLFPFVETAVPTKTDMPGEEIWPTQPIPYSARHVPQQPFCAIYPEVTDPELATRRRPSFHPYQVNEFVIVSPGLLGGPNRGASSFSPRTGLLYVTGKNDAWSIKAKPVGTSIKPAPGSPGHFENIGEQGKTGVTATQNVAAFNPATGELAWVTRMPKGVTNGGVLSTGGQLVFQAIGRDLHALDAVSGALLTTVPLPTSVGSTPMSYQAAGRQFVALATGGTIVALGLP